jgi:hypothetical protein
VARILQVEPTQETLNKPSGRDGRLYGMDARQAMAQTAYPITLPFPENDKVTLLQKPFLST